MTGKTRPIEIGVDTGGTFTDFVIVNFAARTLTGFKVLSTPHDPSQAIFNGLETAIATFGLRAEDVDIVVHATTVATNALIERKGAQVGLVATRGFRDILEMRRETRYDDLDLFPEFPEPLVPRHLRLGVSERIGADGGVVVPLEETEARAVLKRLKSDGVESIAISFLHSYVNPDHERRIAKLAREEIGFASVSASCEVQPEVREYERTSTTVANAYIQSIVQDYVVQLDHGLKERGFDVALQIMQSNGGFAGPAETAAFPVRMVESGPAAGTISAIFHGRRAGFTKLVSFDMGGTTAKIAVLTGDAPPLASELEVARVHRFKPGSGIPLRCPSVALNEIGAGGGSIASIDGVGLLRVGPRSAGAAPGPVCYGRGGSEPTVTDADVVLGYLDPDYFAGGEMRLDKAAAEAAIMDRLARRLGTDLSRTAWGIHDIVNQNMASAARLHILGEGEDPGEFTMIAFGGAGPVHAHRVAAALGMSQVIYPANAGVASAFGLMVAPMTGNYVQTYKSRLAAVDWERVESLFRGMEQKATAAFERESPSGIDFVRAIDFRYVGQGFEIQVDIPPGPYGDGSTETFRQLMLGEYRRVFGRLVEDVPLEIINLRLIGRARRGQRTMDFDYPRSAGGEALKGSRRAYFLEAGGFVETRVHDRLRLAPGSVLEGPVMIEEKDTTVVLPPGASARIDEFRNVVATLPVGNGQKNP
jgi:N-methylhydantoinase A